MTSSSFIPYGRQDVNDEDVEAVVQVLRSDWLTTGPTVVAFERDFAEFTNAHHAIAVNSGTAALHLAMMGLGIGAGDEVIVPALTFAASANAARYVGATVRFADVHPRSLGVDPQAVESLITDRTSAIVVVDYAGLPVDYTSVLKAAGRHDLPVVADSCHAVGATYRGQRLGSLATISTFSFHPVKHLTTGEGGMITTNDASLSERMQRLRNHGIDSDFRSREVAGTWEYDMVELGFNYRLSDINAALGRSQLQRVDGWVARRREIAARYGELLEREGLTHEDGQVQVLEPVPDAEASWHLFPVVLQGTGREALRADLFGRLRERGIGVNVHYRPVYLHSYYQGLGYEAGLCPIAEHAYAGLLSLPMWPGLDDADLRRVVSELADGVASFG